MRSDGSAPRRDMRWLKLGLLVSCLSQLSPSAGAAGNPALQRKGAKSLIWQPATATWYGDPHGYGSDGGACGYGKLVNTSLYRQRTTAASPAIYLKGEGCGECYKVKCVDRSVCSKRAVTVIVTDECPDGGVCGNGAHHFDLSGNAYSRLANPGVDSDLRNRGKIPIIFRRTACKYHGTKIGFYVNEGSTPFWLSLLVKFETGEGDVGSMQIQEKGSQEWLDMQHLWGATWTISPGRPLKAPFSVRIATTSSHSTLIAKDVVPGVWAAGVTYFGPTNFQLQ